MNSKGSQLRSGCPCSRQGVGGPPCCGDWLHPVLETGLWFVPVGLFMDKLPRTPGLSGGFPVRSFSQNGARCLTLIQARALRLGLRLMSSHQPPLHITPVYPGLLPILLLPPAQAACPNQWPKNSTESSGSSVIGLTSTAHNRHSIIIS